MQRKIIWKKWVNPLLSNKDIEDEDEEFKPYKDSYEREERKSVGPILVGPMGIVPIHENVKMFNFVIGHTNFDITEKEVEVLSTIPGVETLDIFTRYRFRVGVGKIFNAKSVRKEIVRLLCGENKEINSGLDTVKKHLRSKYTFWAICILPTGEVETTGDNQKQTVQKKVQEYRATSENKVIASWEE